MKKILIMGANPETASLVMKAKAMGLMTYVADYDPTSYAKKFADVPVNIDASHVEDLIDYVKKEGIDGVLAGVSEALLPYYYEICKKLNYPCFATLEQFEVMISKDKFKNMCRKYQVPVVDEYDTDKTSEVRLPVVVKPVDSCSSKGISVCKNKEELDAGIENALKYSKSGKFIIEKYMTGDEVVIYYVIQNGKAFLVGMCDRYTNKEQKGVAQLPTAYIYPSRYLDSYKKNTDEKVCNMLTKMGIKNGILFLQAFVEDGNVKIYEPGFRLNGAQEHILLSELTGVDAKELLLNFAMTGKMSSYSVSKKAAPDLHGLWGCKLSPLVKPGRIKKIVGLDKIATMDGVISINPSYQEGDIVNGKGTLKQIICRFYIVADTKEELKERIDNLMFAFKVLDENDQDMFLTPFDTNILLKRYK